MKLLDNYRAKKERKALVALEAELDAQVDEFNTRVKKRRNWVWDSRDAHFDDLMTKEEQREFYTLAKRHFDTRRALNYDKADKWFNPRWDQRHLDSGRSPEAYLTVTEDLSTKISYEVDADGVINQVIQRPDEYTHYIKPDGLGFTKRERVGGIEKHPLNELQQDAFIKTWQRNELLEQLWQQEQEQFKATDREMPVEPSSAPHEKWHINIDEERKRLNGDTD